MKNPSIFCEWKKSKKIGKDTVSGILRILISTYGYGYKKRKKMESMFSVVFTGRMI
jgi:hypothetical protein